MYYILTAIIFVVAGILVSALSVLLYELHTHVMRKLNQKSRKKRFDNILLVNPRAGRELRYDTVRAKVRRLALSIFIANRQNVEDDIRKLAEIQGVDNSCLHVDTFKLRISRRNKLDISISYHKVLLALLRSTNETVKRVKRRLNSVTRVVLALIPFNSFKARTQNIKFIQNTGGQEDGESNQNSNRN